MAYTTARVRRARKSHTACGGHCGTIRPGDLYIEHTEFPGPEAEWANGAGHPIRMAECRPCAERYGRGNLIATYEEQHP